MQRRGAFRLITAAAFGALPGCGLPVIRRELVSSNYTIPDRAMDHLHRYAPRGYACWQHGDKIGDSGNSPVFPALSVTKSIAMLTAARAVTKGWLKPDEAVDFPEWRAGKGAGITVRHLLDSTAGLPPGDHELYSARPADKGRAALSLPVVHAPGTVFRYGPASWELLGEFLKRRLPEHGSNLPKFLGETLGHLSISPRGWRRDGGGTPYLSTGISCGIDDLGKLGFALADLESGHNHAGVSADVFHNLSAPHAANPMFSAGIWWNRLAHSFGARPVEPERSLGGEKSPGFWRNACLHPAARPDWLALVGSGGTRVYVLPSASVVIAVARAGDSWSDAAMMDALTSS